MMHHLPYGHGACTVEIDAGKLLPPEPAGFADEIAAIYAALESPEGTAPLAQIVRPGETVAIIVNDITRLARADLILPPIVETLNRAGVADHDILIVFALGNHRRQTEEEQRRIVGDAIFRRIRSLDHDCHDERNLVTLGRTSFGNEIRINRQVQECDRIILTGEIIFHLIAGYSGGRKSLMPGVAAYDTTTFNHRMILDPRCSSGVLAGNPAHEDMVEAAGMADPDFIVNLVLSPSGRLAHVAAGHWERAHRSGCRAADRLLRTPLDAPYDLVIASAGGFPLDIDLRQAHKGMDNAARALKPGGTLLYYAECANGAGVRALEDFAWRYDDCRQMEEALHREFVIGAHKAWWIARLGDRYDIHLVSGLDPAFVRRCHLTPVDPGCHAATLRTLVERLGPSARVAVIPHAGFTVPTQA